MKLVIDIKDDYYDLVKYDVEINHLDYLPYVLIAKGTPFTDEYEKFSDFVVATCSSFAKCSEDKADDIIEELLNHKSKYPMLNLLWDQYCGNFS